MNVLELDAHLLSHILQFLPQTARWRHRCNLVAPQLRSIDEWIADWRRSRVQAKLADFCEDHTVELIHQANVRVADAAEFHPIHRSMTLSTEEVGVWALSRLSRCALPDHKIVASFDTPSYDQCGDVYQFGELTDEAVDQVLMELVLRYRLGADNLAAAAVPMMIGGKGGGKGKGFRSRAIYPEHHNSRSPGECAEALMKGVLLQELPSIDPSKLHPEQGELWRTLHVESELLDANLLEGGISPCDGEVREACLVISNEDRLVWLLIGVTEAWLFEMLY